MTKNEALRGCDHCVELNGMYVIEVYEYYDEPVLFAAKNENEALFLCVFANETEFNDIWLYSPMSLDRFLAVRAGSVSLYDAFKKAEGGRVFQVIAPQTPDGECICDWVPVRELSETWLPEKKEYLNIEG